MKSAVWHARNKVSAIGLHTDTARLSLSVLLYGCEMGETGDFPHCAVNEEPSTLGGHFVRNVDVRASFLLRPRRTH